MLLKPYIDGFEKEKRLIFSQEGLPQAEAQTEPEADNDVEKKSPKSDEEVLERAGEKLGDVSKHMDESQAKFLIEVGKQGQRMQDSVKAKLTDGKDVAHPILDGVKSYEEKLADPKQGGLNVENVREHQRFMHETEKYMGASEEWSFPPSGKVDDQGFPFMYKRAVKKDKDGKETPVLLATSKTAGFQVMDLRTGKWSYANPQEFGFNPQGLSEQYKKIGGEDKEHERTKQMTRNREMEKVVLRNDQFTDITQFDKGADYWQGEENAAIRDRIALLQKIDPKEAAKIAQRITKNVQGGEQSPPEALLEEVPATPEEPQPAPKEEEKPETPPSLEAKAAEAPLDPKEIENMQQSVTDILKNSLLDPNEKGFASSAFRIETVGTGTYRIILVPGGLFYNGKPRIPKTMIDAISDARFFELFNQRTKQYESNTFSATKLRTVIEKMKNELNNLAKKPK
jgi:hypothetical protein